MATPRPLWSSGAAYERYVGRWSRLVAAEFVRRLDIALGARWLDVGCGTGALTQAILDGGKPDSVLAVDSSAAYVERARQTLGNGRVTVEVRDAQYLALPPASFDAAVSGLVLNFVPDRRAMLTGMRDAVVPGGVVAVYVWDYGGGMQLMRWFWDVAAELDPSAADRTEAVGYAFCRPDLLEPMFVDAGLADVTAEAIVVPTVFADFDDYWSPFLSGQGPAPSYCVSLDEKHRHRLRETLRERLPTQPDGSIHLSATAWMVRSTVPA